MLFAKGYLKRKLYLAVAGMVIGTVVQAYNGFPQADTDTASKPDVEVAQVYNRPAHSNTYYEYDEPWEGYVCTREGKGVYVRTEPFEDAARLTSGALDKDPVLVIGQQGAWLFTATFAYTNDNVRTEQVKTGWIKSDYVCEYQGGY